MSENYWLVKAEADLYPITKLKKDKQTQWTDVRNYQARIYLREMKKGDKVLYYHSNAKPSGIVGLAEVVKPAYPDPGQFDSKSDYFDTKATIENPRWFAPDLKFVSEFKEMISLEEVKKIKALNQMQLIKNSRLSVQKVTLLEYNTIVELAVAHP
jgi:predicted RNA-binding protein with PUA-like domain